MFMNVNSCGLWSWTLSWLLQIVIVCWPFWLYGTMVVNLTSTVEKLAKLVLLSFCHVLVHGWLIVYLNRCLYYKTTEYFNHLGPFNLFEKAKELKEMNLYAAKHLFLEVLRSPSVVSNCSTFRRKPCNYSVSKYLYLVPAYFLSKELLPLVFFRILSVNCNVSNSWYRLPFYKIL